MKLKAITLAIFVAGLGASFALADDGGHGKGKGKDAASTSSTSSTSTSTTESKKVTLCHKAGPHGKWVKVSVSKSAAKSKLKHGDVAPDADGKCPAKSVPVTTTTTETTTTT